MPIILALPPESERTEQFRLSFAAATAAELHRHLAMAWALHLEAPNRNNLWLKNAINDLNTLVAELCIDVAQPAPVADPIDALFDRANVLALNGQVLR
jgi:hypothetical protein